MLSQERLREIVREIGQRYPAIKPSGTDHLILNMVQPYSGHVYWHIRAQTVDDLRADEAWRHASLVVRVYDVTGIRFDGRNAHGFFDIAVHALTGNCYFGIERPGRNQVAEIGLHRADNRFHTLARSKETYFDRDRPSGHYQTAGLFVGRDVHKTFSVENIFDARVYEKMSQELADVARPDALTIATLFIDIRSDAHPDSPLGEFIHKTGEIVGKFGAEVRLFSAALADSADSETLLERVRALAETVFAQVAEAHRTTPFRLIHCHDWPSLSVGLRANRELRIPLILSLHATEHERTPGYHPLSAEICAWEKQGVNAASLIIVPHSSTRQQVINLYGADPDRTVIIPDVLAEHVAGLKRTASEIKRGFGLNQEAPLLLFAGELSHAAGADLLMDALPIAFKQHATAQIVFAGDGPLRGELEGRAWHAGLGERCRFFGDVPSDTFESLLLAADFVVIPARTWQGESLAQMAIDHGKPVLTTHQAGTHCVAHGQNGLVAYDNPGSIVWGIQELLGNPLQGNLLRSVAKKKIKMVHHWTPLAPSYIRSMKLF